MFLMIDNFLGQQFLFSNALGGSFGFFPSKINIKKNKQIVVKTMKGTIRIALFIFL